MFIFFSFPPQYCVLRATSVDIQYKYSLFILTIDCVQSHEYIIIHPSSSNVGSIISNFY